jgi:uncharacterized protein YecT (DUF1311 family)
VASRSGGGVKKNYFSGDDWQITAPQTTATPLAGLLVMILLSSLLAATRSFADNNCQEPRDFGVLAHCFLAQYRCLPNYFGIDAAPNYSEALKCFERNRRWPFVVLMYLNGEGVRGDPKKAASVLRSAEKTDPDEFGPHQTEILQKAIARCAASPRAGCPKLDYCKDLCVTTPEMEICDAVAQVSDEAAFSRTIDGIRGQLSMVDRTVFDRVIAEFKAYQLKDMEREHQAYAGASLGGMAGANQAGFIRENFLKLMTGTVAERRLKPNGTEAFEAVNRRLARALDRDLYHNTEAQQELLGDPDEKALWDRSRSDIEGYRNAARESQLQWIKFRDSCTQLATSLYRDRAGNFDPAVSMKVRLTKDRIAELRSEPFAPESK